MIYDLSFEVEIGMPTCGTAWHQNVEIVPLGTIMNTGRNTHKIVLGSHSGTHMDAPYHFLGNGDTIEMLDAGTLWGEAEVIDLRYKKQGDIVTVEDIKKAKIADRMIFVFGWYHNWKTDNYYRRFPFFSIDAINYLVKHGMKFMAMDTPSPDSGDAITASRGEDSPNHKILLREKVVIVEYLNNTDVLKEGRKYEVVALPLKIKGCDGSPARVLIKEIK